MSLGLEDSYSPFATQWSAVKPTRIYILNGEPDTFAFQNLRDENQPVLIVERKDSGLGKFSYKSKKILICIFLKELAMFL